MILTLSVKSNSIPTEITNVSNRIINAGLSGVREATRAIFSDSQTRAPVSTGALVSSGSWDVDQEAGSISGVIGYGDSRLNPKTGVPTSAYAVDVHEDVRSAGYKYLELAVLNNDIRFIQALANSIRSSI
jgi:hypothetical protein